MHACMYVCMRVYTHAHRGDGGLLYSRFGHNYTGLMGFYRVSVGLLVSRV